MRTARLCVLLSAMLTGFLIVTAHFRAYALPVLSALVTCIADGCVRREDKSRALAAVPAVPRTAALTTG
ncbi:hypothetical protein [Amycolatopsis sp. NPDC004079]|uniref:hypothetical protein n=1 Tax=Amycolatopsis sp. NPDC004079 TaxID=3154549 RepID=UPI0033A9E3AA